MYVATEDIVRAELGEAAHETLSAIGIDDGVTPIPSLVGRICRHCARVERDRSEAPVDWVSELSVPMR